MSKSKVLQLGRLTLDIRTSSVGEQWNTGTRIQVEALSSVSFKIQLDLASADVTSFCYSHALIKVLYQMTSRDPFWFPCLIDSVVYYFLFPSLPSLPLLPTLLPFNILERSN